MTATHNDQHQSKLSLAETGPSTHDNALGTLSRTTVFETAPFNHSGTPPQNNWHWLNGPAYVAAAQPALKGIVRFDTSGHED